MHSQCRGKKIFHQEWAEVSTRGLRVAHICSWTCGAIPAPGNLCSLLYFLLKMMVLDLLMAKTKQNKIGSVPLEHRKIVSSGGPKEIIFWANILYISFLQFYNFGGLSRCVAHPPPPPGVLRVYQMPLGVCMSLLLVWCEWKQIQAAVYFRFLFPQH